MDNRIFRETYGAINACACVYEKTLLTNQGRCARAARFCIAEREGVRCNSERARQRCRDWLEQLRARARFALKTADAGAALPHAKAVRVQVGGLRGLYASLHPDRDPPVDIDDIDALLEAAIARFGALDALPFAAIMRQIAAYRGRRPRPGASRDR